MLQEKTSKEIAPLYMAVVFLLAEVHVQGVAPVAVQGAARGAAQVTVAVLDDNGST